MEDINDVTYRLRKIIPVTRKEDPICANNIYLSKKGTTFGRIVSSDVQERLLSKNTPLMISRKHATIVVEGGNINISDHQSMNGVYINNKRIRSGIHHSIKHGDKIAFGCGVDSAPPEFEYVVEAVCSNHLKRHDISKIQEDIQGSQSKRQRAADIPGMMIIESNSVHIKEQEEKIKKLTRELQQKEYHQNEMLNKLQEKEKGLIAKLEQQKCELERDRSDAEEYLRGLLEKQLTEKENFLRSEYDEQINNLQSEKDLVEKNLHEELSKKLSEKDKAYQQELEQQKSMLEQAMLSKEHEKYVLIAELQAKEGLIEKYKSVEENQKQLESCLQELKKEIQEKENQLKKQQEVTKKVEIDAKQTVIQTMEDEFTCIICQELFIEATTLPCAHTFCEVCLRLWMRKKKTCPVCRRRIKDKAVRSVVLDSAVEKMIDSMDDETKQRRKVLLRERSEQKRRDDATEGKVPSGSSRARVSVSGINPQNVIYIS